MYILSINSRAVNEEKFKVINRFILCGKTFKSTNSRYQKMWANFLQCARRRSLRRIIGGLLVNGLCVLFTASTGRILL